MNSSQSDHVKNRWLFFMKKKIKNKTHFAVHRGIFAVIQHNNLLSVRREIYKHITHIIVHNHRERIPDVYVYGILF